MRRVPRSPCSPNFAEGAMTPDQAAALAMGIRLRAYKFDRYKTKKKDGEDAPLHAEISVAVEDVAATRKAFAPGGACRRRRHYRPRSRQRAAERALPGGVRASRRRIAQARRRGRDPRRQGDDQTRHGRAARRGAGLGAAGPARRHALERRQGAASSRSPSSARASASTPAAFPSSRPAAWRT